MSAHQPEGQEAQGELVSLSTLFELSFDLERPDAVVELPAEGEESNCDTKMKTEQARNEKPKKARKYTIQEFWDSLYWELTDCDDDYDGYLHIVSTINGTEKTILLTDLIQVEPARKRVPCCGHSCCCNVVQK